MGATTKWFSLPATFSQKEVTEYFESRQDSDRQEYLYEHDGDEDGAFYSGGFNTNSGLRFFNREFEDFEKAEEFCSENSEKWGNAVAVKYKHEEKLLWLVFAWCAE